MHALNGVDITLAAGRSARTARRVRLRQERHACARCCACFRRAAPRSPARSASRARTCSPSTRTALEQLRGGVVSMIFQEPMLALDPVYTIGDQIAETVVRHEGVSWADGRKRALEMLEVVRIPSAKPPARRLSARDVGRHAPARDDRARALLPAEGAAGRRADHRARRHRADPDSAAAARTSARDAAWRSSSSPTTSAWRSRSPTASR